MSIRHRIFARFAPGVAGLVLALNAAAQQPATDSGERRGPPPEALAACEGKSAGDPCSFSGPRGDKPQGTCFAPEGKPLACRPSQAPER